MRNSCLRSASLCAGLPTARARCDSLSKLTAAIIFVFCCSANGATTYQYVGPNFNDIVDDDNPPAGSYTTAMNLTLTITLDAPLPAAGSQIDFTSNLLSYSASDGRHVLTESNSTLSGFAFVNQNSEIFGHLVTVKTGPLGLQDGDPTGLSEGDQLITMNTDFIDPGSAGDLASVIQCVAAPCILGDGDFDRDLAQNRINIPGTWSIVPIPAAAWLFGSALGLLGWARRGNI